MIVQSLSNDLWRMHQTNTNTWYKTRVPGCVHTTLMKEGVIPDPFVGDNEKRVKWVAESDWEYTLTFIPDSELLEQAKIFLVCDGLDTIAQVTLNDYILGNTNDMFIQYEWDVKNILIDGENIIKILFHSPTLNAAKLMASRPLPEVTQAIPGGNYIRKAPCQFGWDWGPQLPPIGIWKDIRLEGYNTAKIREILINQVHNRKHVNLKFSAEITQFDSHPMKIKFQIISPEGNILIEDFSSVNTNTVKKSFEITNPQLWYPNGYGKQPLYKIIISLHDENHIEDSKEYSIGLRTVELVQEKDEWGKSFRFTVNGIPIFAKGANWIPADSFPTRITRNSLEELIRSAASTHQNMLRVWGGGFYESDLFYELCDQYGILIWQDMIFSCAVYPLNDHAFLEILKEEIKQNVRRLRHHACLTLWCGNNEMEWGWEGWGWQKPELKDMQNAYDAFFHNLLPDWVNEVDKNHPYWPSSPSSNTPFNNVNSENVGDCHYWEVWHGRKPFTAYRDHFPRFMSEFGFQSLPPMDTIKTYATPSDWNMTSYIMEHHQKNNSGNGLIIAQMTDTFRMPKDFASLVYLSMVLQAEGIRYGVEHWRRNKHRVSGTLYWQLNDCWPVASWSSLDYYGNWKALHYSANHFYSPVLLSLKDENQKIGVYVTSDLTTCFYGTISWQLLDLQGNEIESGKESVDLAAYETRQIMQKVFNLTYDECRRTVFTCNLEQDGKVFDSKLVTFVPNKHLELEEPQIEWKISQENSTVIININSKKLARFVECNLPGMKSIFSDNYFDLLPGKNKKVYTQLPENCSLQQFAEKFSIRSLHDSFA